MAKLPEVNPALRPVILPVIVIGFIVLVVVIWFFSTGGDQKPEAAPPTSTETPSAAPTPVSEQLTPSGDAPAAIAVSEVTVARSASGIGLAADLPTLDVERVASVTVEIDADGRTWTYTSTKDPLGRFVTPSLFEGDVEYACANGTMKLSGNRLSSQLPQVCFGDSLPPVSVRLVIEDVDGEVEETSLSSPLSPPA